MFSLLGCSSLKTIEADGFKLLFDGETTKGSHTYGENEEAWQISHNELYLNPSMQGRGNLITDKEFNNFQLKLEWKIAANGNSGILFNVHEDKSNYPNAHSTGP